MGGIAHLGNGERIENSVIVVKDGKFDIVADANRIRIDHSSFRYDYKNLWKKCLSHLFLQILL